MPRSKSGVKRRPVSKEDLEKAVEAVMKKECTAYSAAKDYNVDKATLSRQLKKFKESGLNTFEYRQNNDVNKVFTDNEEKLLVEYILNSSHLNYGLTLQGVRAFAYQFASVNGKNMILLGILIR